MRTTTMFVVVMLGLGLMGCNIAEVGGPETSSCELAAQHVTSCIGSSLQVQVDDVCDASAAALSEAVLQQPCSAIVGDRSTSSLKDLLCMVLPFLCPANNNPVNPGPGQPGPGQPGPGQPAGQPNLFRINDCWSDPQWGFCYDVVKINPGSGCTDLLEPHEWKVPTYSHYQCLQPDGARCRLVRVCRQFADKGQCISSVQQHNDLPTCQAGQPQPNPQQPGPQQPGPQQPGNPGGCTSDADCAGGEACYFNQTCIPLHSQPAGASCQHVDGSYRTNLCQQGLGCTINFSGGQTQSACGQLQNP